MKIKGIRWIGFNSLMNRLGINEIELFQIIQQNRIPAYRLLSKTEFYEDIMVIPQPIQQWDVEADHRPSQLVFDTGDVEQFIERNKKQPMKNNNPLTKKTRKDTLCRIDSREYAEINWKKGTTAEELFDSPGIDSIITKHEVKRPTLSTFRDRWMKGLNPNRKGRPTNINGT